VFVALVRTRVPSDVLETERPAKPSPLKFTHGPRRQVEATPPRAGCARRRRAVSWQSLIEQLPLDEAARAWAADKHKLAVLEQAENRTEGR